MRMKHAHPKSGSRRRATNVSLRADLVEEARALEINLSKELEARLEALVREARATQWKKDNQRAIAAYTRYFEKHGIWNEESRGW
jgi:antitoxin CcdA